MKKLALSIVASVSAGQRAPKKNEFSDIGAPFVRAGSLDDLLSGKNEADLELGNGVKSALDAYNGVKSALDAYGNGVKSALDAYNGVKSALDAYELRTRVKSRLDPIANRTFRF
jgi:type I restriction enzyme S subunit